MNSAGMIRLRFCFCGCFEKGEIYAKQGLVCRYHCTCVCVPCTFDETRAAVQCSGIAKIHNVYGARDRCGKITGADGCCFGA